MNAESGSARCACGGALGEAVSVWELTERRHASHPRDEASIHVCATCGARWRRNRFDIDGPNARESIEPEVAAAVAVSCHCAAARASGSIDATMASKVLAHCDCVSTMPIEIHHHYDQGRSDRSRYVCRVCSSDWTQERFDFDTPIERRVFEPTKMLTPSVAASCGCAAMKVTEPLPAGRAEQQIIDGCDVVAKYEDAIHYRCRSCSKGWMYRRYDRGHVAFDFLEPI